MSTVNTAEGKNILIYFQNPIRNIFFESFVPELIKKGHHVFFLTNCSPGILHKKIEELGAVTAAYSPGGPGFLKLIRHWWFLIRYCRKNKIDILFSHLQLNNLIALLAQYFIRAGVYPCRHHADAIRLEGNKKSIFIDKIVSRLSKKIIVVSDAAKKFMVDHENVRDSKITVIPLGYNFELYNKPEYEKVLEIKKQMDCHLLLIIISRMTPGKRHILALEALNILVKKGLDIKLILLDEGAEEKKLKNFVEKNNLGSKVLFTGFLSNIMDYTAAADLLLHPSESEASNQVVREAANLEKPCIACKNAGDFEEYIIHRKNSFLVSKENTRDEMCDLIKEFYYKKDELKEIGKAFKKDVLAKFSMKNIADKYLQLGNC
jgi:glycosyltransferase involved in cell wall biosynthesis